MTQTNRDVSRLRMFNFRLVSDWSETDASPDIRIWSLASA